MSGSEFTGKTVLVTGGSRGIGRAAADRLAAEGARVAINYVANAAAANEAAESIRQSGGQAVTVQGDVANPESARQIAAVTRQALGPIDVLVHCAGLSVIEPADDVTWESWRQIMSVNLDGTFNMVYAVKDEMIARKFGRIVTLSSVAALRPRQNQVHYASAKAGVIAFTRCCAEAWAKHNVRLNGICPGLIDTDMAKVLTPEMTAGVIRDTPLGRLGRADEIANLIRFLVSEESSFLTGESIAISGGRVVLP